VAATPVRASIPSSVSAGAQSLSGAWGTIEVRDVVLDPRSDYLNASMCGDDPPTWTLPGLGAAETARLYDAAALTPTHRADLDAATSCATTRSGSACVVRPSLDLVASLSPVERAGLYAGIGRFEANAAQAQPMRRPAGQLEARFREAGVSEPSLVLLRSLLYRDGGQEAFADMQVMCARAPKTGGDRDHILTAVVREHGVLATLKVPEGADVEALARWWGVGRRGKDLHALLGSLARAPGGGTVDVMHLLPRFARARVNTFPEPTDPPYDCAYTALSFFSPDGEARFLKPAEVKRAIDTEYHPVPGDALQLGDVLIFTADDGTLVHAVVHVAGDLVFSKNGIAFHKPWQLARRSELEAEYGHPKIYAYRRNGLDGK
jgi:hypothetical protein